MDAQTLADFENTEVPSAMTMKMRLIKRKFKHIWQRKVRGFDDSETWDLGFTFAKWFAPRLRRFKEVTIAFPGNFNSMDEWQAVLQEMLEGFELMADEDVYFPCPEDSESQKKIQRSLDLFHEYIYALWW